MRICRLSEKGHFKEIEVGALRRYGESAVDHEWLSATRLVMATATGSVLVFNDGSLQQELPELGFVPRCVCAYASRDGGGFMAGSAEGQVVIFRSGGASSSSRPASRAGHGAAPGPAPAKPENPYPNPNPNPNRNPSPNPSPNPNPNPTPKQARPSTRMRASQRWSRRRGRRAKAPCVRCTPRPMARACSRGAPSSAR